MAATLGTCVIRSSLILLLMASVVTVLYFTPMPEHYFKSCDRPCHPLDWPMICRVKLTLELFQTLNRFCEDCPKNKTNCSNLHCITADGYSRSLLTANRQLPGPSIQVCKNDILVVDVVNRIPNHGVTIHWRGQHQRETPFMDGVPMVTQCPIPSYTTFQYKFRASNAGTHYYNAFSGSETADGIFGALIVRQPITEDPNRVWYDIDDKNHVIVVSQWNHHMAIENVVSSRDGNVDTFLINGKGNYDKLEIPAAQFVVDSGKRYRFRLAYTGGVQNCAMNLTIEGHGLKVVALDGSVIVPVDVDNIILNRGERADFVVNTDQKIGNYNIKVSSAKECETKIKSSAVLSYSNKMMHKIDDNLNDIMEVKTVNKVLSTVETTCGDKNMICLSEVKPLNALKEELKSESMDRKIYLSIGLTAVIQGVPTTAHSGRLRHVANRTFTFPSSPLLTQIPTAADEDMFCSKDHVPETCRESAYCECVHIRYAKLGATVEVVLVDEGGDSDHVYHFHGNDFAVVAVRQFSSTPTLSQVQKLDEDGALFSRNLEDPVTKDTVTLPKNGVVAFRFVADNPGFWLLREEHSGPWSRGLDVLFQIGERLEFVPPPSDFPKCGSYIGPEFFLI